jgi:hypothetical protein
MGGKKESKAIYFDKLETLLKEYKSIFIVTVDNVSSQQMHEIRQSLRGDGVVLMGKNTMVRRALKGLIAESPEYERLLPHVRGESPATRHSNTSLTALQATSASSSPTPTSRRSVTRSCPTVSPPPPVLVLSRPAMSSSPPETRRPTYHTP